MKKFLLVAMAVFAVVACSKDDEDSAYSEQQSKVQAMFTGTYADYQYSNLNNPILGDPDLIVFTKSYPEPVELTKEDYLNGSKYMGEAHGECVYKKKLLNDRPYTDIECYYGIGYDGKSLTLYNVSDKEIYHHYTMNVVSNSEFRLYQSGLSLPYIFKKQ